MGSLRQLSRQARVATLFNTHWHPENTGANEVLRQGGATIVAAREHAALDGDAHLAAGTRIATGQPRPKDAHPNKTFYVDGSMNAGSERIDYGYLIEAHTSGDIYVFFRDSNVLAVGDVASPARDPGAGLPHRRVDRRPRRCDGPAADAERRRRRASCPGYGPVMSRAELQAERDVMKTIYDRTVDRVRQGDYVDDMLKAGVMNGLARTWKDPQKFLYDVHKGLWAHHNKLAPQCGVRTTDQLTVVLRLVMSSFAWCCFVAHAQPAAEAWRRRVVARGSHSGRRSARGAGDDRRRR